MNEPPEQADTDRPAAGPEAQLFTRTGIYALSAGFTAGFTVASWAVVTWIQHRPFMALFTGALSPGRQLPVGLAVGLAASAVTTWIALHTPALERLRRAVGDILAQVGAGAGGFLFVSLGAGWGEELFFRGLLQGYLGLWWTALLFALLHGFFIRWGWPGLLLTVYVFAAGVGLGYLYEQAGLVAAMCAHAVYDFVSLCGYAHYLKKASAV